MNTKVILGLIAGVVIVCLCAAAGSVLLVRSTGVALGRTAQNGGDRVAEVSASIAGYDLPAGFAQGFATDVADFSLVSYTGDDQHSHIYFFQVPSYIHIDQSELERQFKETSGGEWQNWAKTEVVGTQPATICGQAVDLVVSEGTNRDGQTFRQVSGMFQGKGGKALVIFEAPVSSWDQAVVDKFLASIH